MTDRRSDLGSKITVGIITGIFMIVIGFFINTLIGIAVDGKSIALLVQGDLKSLRSETLAQYLALSGDMTEIKLLLKRSIPREV